MRSLMLGAMAVIAAVATAVPGQATETYDLIFRKGTLDEIPSDAVLNYTRDVFINGNEEYSTALDGEIRLSFEEDDMARLRFHQGERLRNIGAFPATVGNPMIMYFVESVIRDMAHTTGGSQFYIRNRIKESLISFAEINSADRAFGSGEVGVQEITLRPFRGDPNVARMQGFGGLTLTVSMSADVPGWYYALSAEAKTDDGTEVYSHSLQLEGMNQ